MHDRATIRKHIWHWYDFSISRTWCKCMIDSEVKKKKNANNEDPNNKSNFLNGRYSSITQSMTLRQNQTMDDNRFSCNLSHAILGTESPIWIR